MSPGMGTRRQTRGDQRRSHVVILAIQTASLNSHGRAPSWFWWSSSITLMEFAGRWSYFRCAMHFSLSGWTLPFLETGKHFADFGIWHILNVLTAFQPFLGARSVFSVKIGMMFSLVGGNQHIFYIVVWLWSLVFYVMLWGGKIAAFVYFSFTGWFFMVDILVICMIEESEILCSFVEPLLNCHSCLMFTCIFQKPSLIVVSYFK